MGEVKSTAAGVKIQLWAQVGDSAAMYRVGEIEIDAAVTGDALEDRLTELAQELEDRLLGEGR